MKRIFILAVLILAGSVYGDDVSVAKQALDAAELRLTNAKNDVAAAKRELNRAENALADANNRTNAAAAKIQRLQAILNDTQTVAQATADAQSAKQAADEKSAELKTAQTQVDGATKKIGEIRAKEKAAFEASEPFIASGHAIEIAQKKYDQAAAASAGEMESDPKYAALEHESDLAKENVQRLRTSSDPGVNEASKSWIASENQVGTFKQKWLDADQNVSDAKLPLLEANADREKLAKKFEDDLAGDSQMIAAVDELASQKKSFAAVNTQLQQANRSRTATESHRQIVQGRFDDAKIQIGPAQVDMQNAQADANRFALEVQDLDQRLQGAMAKLDDAKRDRDVAFAAWKKARNAQNK